jgi:hypothetical protein
MNEVELKERTKAFAKRVLKVVDALPDTPKCRVIVYQLTAIMSSSRITAKRSLRRQSPIANRKS